jgi:hypothetical protein
MKYPIIELIQNTMSEKGLTRKQICHNMGYSKMGKAFEHFDNCLNNGCCGDFVFQERLAKALEVDMNIIKRAIEATMKIKSKEKKKEEKEKEDLARLKFKPHLWVLPERSVPSPIFVVCFMGEATFRFASLPDGIANMSMEKQKEIVKETIQTHFKEKNGLAGPFGKVLQYQYRITYDSHWLVSTDGEFIKLVENEPIKTSSASLIIGGKTIETSPSGLLEKINSRI